jgi:hypothetical protein
MNNNFFQNPMRILSIIESIHLLDYYNHSKTNINLIYVNELIPRFLNAQVGDIICINEPKKQVYRLVVNYC